ncbi:DUF2147 domain-containing protein [Lysobacter sp. F6437]|uniref:DUF2147 domain-containing protein n=1 Tax=Lysobacter sp. F6437 TaxID=3459296 RepID=UPI00403DC4DE
MRIKMLALLLLALPMAAFAQTSTPVGSWTTIDDDTGKAKSVVEIYETRDGSLAGRVVDVLQSDQGENPVCNKCKGDRKGQPVEGMVIMWGLERDGDSWEGGKILDPANGKEYSVKVTPSTDGSKLEVRGFMGFSLLGRTQTWMRQ